jgi:hypothetical protein
VLEYRTIFFFVHLIPQGACEYLKRQLAEEKEWLSDHVGNGALRGALVALFFLDMCVPPQSCLLVHGSDQSMLLHLLRTLRKIAQENVHTAQPTGHRHGRLVTQMDFFLFGIHPVLV